MKTSKQGVSLIVLVITIIVMIILAAAIIISLNNTGIIGAAENAVCKTNIKQAQNVAILKWSELYIDGQRDTEVIKEKIKEEFTKNKLNPDNYEITVTTGGVEVSAKAGCVDIAGGVTEPDDNNTNVETDWVYAYTYSNADYKWTTYEINDGTEPTGDVVVKLYIAGNVEKNINNDLVALNTYKMTVEGTGDIPLDAIGNDLYENSEHSIKVLDTVVELEIQEGMQSISRHSMPSSDDNRYKMIENVKLPNSLTNIGLSAFENCTKLKKINIPSGVTGIGSYAFRNCELMEDIQLPDVLKSVGGYAFAGCDTLTSITIPGALEFVQGYLFYECKNLKTVNISEGIKTINMYSFAGCESLENVTFPSTLTTMLNGAFANCTSLKQVNLPSKFESIESGSFGNCTSLEVVVIPNTLISIGSGAFYGAKSTMTVKYRGTKDEWNAIDGEENIPTEAAIVYNYTGE